MTWFRSWTFLASVLFFLCIAALVQTRWFSKDKFTVEGRVKPPRVAVTM